MNEFGPEDLGDDIDPETGNFFKKPETGTEQPKPVEAEKSEIDLELYERSLKDGTADEYREAVGALPAEALLEEQGDERVWSELSEAEKGQIRELLKAYAEANGLTVEEDDDSCMVV